MDLKLEVESRLDGRLIAKIYNEVDSQTGPDDKGDIQGTCPFHKEKNPSFGFNINRLGQYKCFSCGTTGNIYTYVREIKQTNKPLIWLADFLGIDLKSVKQIQKFTQKDDKQQESVSNSEKLTINKKLIIDAKTNLWEKNNTKIKQLVDFGISEKIINSHNLGYMNGRFWIPIKDAAGDFVNIRKYDPNRKDHMKIISHSETIDGKKQGFGSDRLWPISALNSDTIYILEGEKDVLVARSLGLNALTNTTGAKNWKYGEEFKNKNVIICMDIDEPGRDGSIRRARKIYEHASQIKIINLPLDKTAYPRGDFTDYITSEGNSKDDFIKLVEDADVYVSNTTSDDTEYKVILAEASKARYINKKCFIKNVLCCGKDQAPFGAPKKIVATCHSAEKSQDSCMFCKLLDESSKTLIIKKDNPILLDLIRDSKQNVYARLRRFMGVKDKCKSYKLKVEDFYNIEKVRIVPDITYNIEEDFEQVYRTGYYITDDDTKIETNRGYNVNAITCMDTKTQYVQHQIYDISSSQTNIDDFELTPEIIKKLRKFQPKPEETISQKINDIYKDLSRLARIYGRNDVFLLYDLSFHSAITFDFQGKNIGKGWVEAAIVGDSGQGKSEVAKFQTRHYRAGEIVSGESCSLAGLVGGLSQIGGNWHLQWGRLPLNDRRLVIMEEATGTKTEDIAKLSEIRSSGEAKIVKVTTEATRARARIIWLANPRKENLGIKNYPYGVITVKELFGQPEDVRRCDIAMTVASGEIDVDLMNQVPEEFVPTYDSDSCHALIMFAWSRKSKDIKITKEVEKHILKKSSELSKIYNSSIPLVEPADMRNKLARLTVSLAIRLFAINDDLIVEPRIEHVDAICNFLKSIYNKPRFAYDDYSRKEFAKTNLTNKLDVAEILNLRDKDNIEDLLQSATPSKHVISDCINSREGVELQPREKQYRMKIRKLKRSNALDEHERYFVLQPGFLDMLKKLKKHNENGGWFEQFFADTERVMSDGVVMD